MIVGGIKKVSIEYYSGRVQEFDNAQVTLVETERAGTNNMQFPMKYYQITIPVEGKSGSSQ